MTDKYTPIFNEVLEALCKINLSPYETRVLMAIWRKTYGFIDITTGQRKKIDYIATSQIAEMCSLDKRHVSRALKGLKDKKVISRDDKKTGFSKEFMKLLSSVEGISPIEMTDKEIKESEDVTKGASRGDGVSPVEAPQIESIKETITNVIGDKSPVKKDFRNKDIEEGIELLRKTFNSVTKERLNRFALNRLYKKYQKEMVLKVFAYSQKIAKDQYSPKVYNFIDLEEKWEKIKAYGIKQREEITEQKKPEERVFTGTDGTRIYKYILVDGERKEVV